MGKKRGKKNSKKKMEIEEKWKVKEENEEKWKMEGEKWKKKEM